MVPPGADCVAPFRSPCPCLFPSWSARHGTSFVAGAVVSVPGAADAGRGWLAGSGRRATAEVCAVFAEAGRPPASAPYSGEDIAVGPGAGRDRNGYGEAPPVRGNDGGEPSRVAVHDAPQQVGEMAAPLFRGAARRASRDVARCAGSR